MGVIRMNIRYAVAVPWITSNISDNLGKILSMMNEASMSGVNLLLFPETTLTGLNISDDYYIDRQYAFSLESPPVRAIVDNAADCKMWTAFGFLELSSNTIFDSAILVDESGEIVLHHRRMSPGWKAPNADPLKYGNGTRLSTFVAPWGKTAILICGDLFETAFPYAVEAGLDLLLFPFARCFSPEIKELQEQWNNVEWLNYSTRIKQIGSFTLMSNYIASDELSGGSFGGGFIVDPDGVIVKAKPLFEEGLLIWDHCTK
jgi:predicted amidohydrolase